MRKRNTPVYAIVRIDDNPSETVENCITIKEIVWSLEEAETEVARLNELNRSKGCRYFWQYTRLVDPQAGSESRDSV
jgi:hypothetical protein